MTREEQLDWLCRLRSEIYVFMPKEWLKPMDEALTASIKTLEQEPKPDIEEKIHKMKTEIADTLEFWDYSPNNNPLARDMLETITNFWGEVEQ